MSSAMCHACKHERSCTYPQTQVITGCDEFEYVDPRDSRQASDETAWAADAQREEPVESAAAGI